jgi:hypothetical protein
MPGPQVERPQMPDYGVDTPDWRGLPWSWAAERLAANRNFWLVTAPPDGRPHALPVWGVWHDGDAQFAFSCGPRSRKAANLAANPNVVVAIADTVECVSIEGEAHPVHGDRLDTWIERYLAKYAVEAPDLSADFVRANCVFEVRPERAFGIIEREDAFARRATRWRFDA